MNTKNEDIQALQEMRIIQRELQTISKGLQNLDKSEDDIDIDYNNYNTHHAEQCEAEKKDAVKQSEASFIKKKKSSVRKFSLLAWLSLAAGIAIIAIFKEVLLGWIVAPVGLIVKIIAKKIISKKISKESATEIARIEAEYKIKLEKAIEEDKKEDSRYDSDWEAALKNLREKNEPARIKLEKQKQEYEDKLNKIRIISDNDMKNIPALINILESNRADNIKEALLVMDEQIRRENEEKEKRRREEAEIKRQRQAEEAARLASLPGTVHIRIGSINTYSGKLQTVRNNIYFDGALYGAGDASGATTFQLNPGVHNVYAQLQEAGYIFTTPNQTFNLSGNGDVYLKIMIRNARASITLCSSSSDFMSN